MDISVGSPHPQAMVGFNSGQYLTVFYWPFVRADGSAGIQSRVKIKDGAHVVAIDEETKRVYVIEIHRETDSGMVTAVEIPGGGIEPGSSPLDAAQQELLEEVGVVGDDSEWVPLFGTDGMHPIDGLAITSQHAFLLLSGRKIREPEHGETRAIKLHTFSDLVALDNGNGFHDPIVPYILRRAKDWLGVNRPDLLT